MTVRKNREAYKNQKLEMIRDLLTMGPAPVRSIAKVICLTERATRHYVSYLRLAGEIHIACWEQPNPGWPYRPVFALGAGEDVPCPLTGNVWRDAPHAAKKVVEVVKRDPLVAALFGEVPDGDNQATTYGVYVHRLGE